MLLYFAIALGTILFADSYGNSRAAALAASHVAVMLWRHRHRGRYIPELYEPHYNTHVEATMITLQVDATCDSHSSVHQSCGTVASTMPLSQHRLGFGLICWSTLHGGVECMECMVPVHILWSIAFCSS